MKYVEFSEKQAELLSDIKQSIINAFEKDFKDEPLAEASIQDFYATINNFLKELNKKTIFMHDCDCCEYLGYLLSCSSNKGVIYVYELYICYKNSNKTLIARYGNAPEDYKSFNLRCLKKGENPEYALQFEPELLECYNRAFKDEKQNYIMLT